MDDMIVNKVAQSPLVQIDLEEYFPVGQRIVIDIREQLYMGMILKEKDFRDWIKAHDWEQYRDQFVAIVCTEDAIVPTWAYMLLSAKLAEVAKLVVYGDLNSLEQAIWTRILNSIALNTYVDAKVVIKGCSKNTIPVYAYVELTRLLRPIAGSIMFGEPCSTVPLYKKSK